MTKLGPIAIAYSLLLNEIHIIFGPSILKNGFLTSNLVYMLTNCVILSHLTLFPSALWQRANKICSFLEVPITLVTLEVSLYYIWNQIQEYVLFNSDAILVHLADNWGLEWLVCHMCCSETNCPYIFTDRALNILSFLGLVTTVCAFYKKD